MSGHQYGWDGWDIVERATRSHVSYDAEQRPGTAIALNEDIVSKALLVEMERPPWYRDIDAHRKALREEMP